MQRTEAARAWLEEATGAADGEGALRPALGVVRGTAGAEVTVELYTGTGGAGFTLTAPAILHADYQAGDTVLVIHYAGDPAAAVVVGRVGNAGDRLTAANVLALLLGVDGAGSGLDADTLDGQHEAALLRADGSRPLSADWDAGAGRRLRAEGVRARATSGLRLEDSTGALGVMVEAGGNVGVKNSNPAQALDVTGGVQSSGGVRVAEAIGAEDAFLSVGRNRTASGYAYVTLHGDNVHTYGVRLIRWNDGADADSLLTHRGGGDLILQTESDTPVRIHTASVERLRVRNAGLAISGPGAAFDPQGALHVHDGTGGWLQTSKTAITTTAQVIIPDAAGDVTALALVDALVSNGTLRTSMSFTLEQGAVSTQNITVGAETYQFRLNASGSLDVRRTAGTAAGKVVVRVLWL